MKKRFTIDQITTNMVGWMAWFEQEKRICIVWLNLLTKCDF